jgi:glutamyl aminopeptidase
MFILFSDINKSQKYSTMLNESSPEVGFRLSQNVKPIFYDLYLIPDLDKGSFEGRVSIFINITGTQKSITLHQKDLNISKVTLMPISLVKLDIKESYSNEKDETFTIVPKEELSDVTYHLNLSFSGSLSDKIVGFYSSRYKDERNKTR